MQISPLYQETADALGIPLEDLLTQISFETGGTLDPRQSGPTTQWGQHRGLIQWGEPQARQYGVDFSSEDAALRSQLGREGAVVRYALDRGFVPGEHQGLDLYSAINAGYVGLNHRSDAHNGGTPGTVADKYNDQMASHRAKVRGLIGDDPGQMRKDRTLRSAGVTDIPEYRRKSREFLGIEDDDQAKRAGRALQQMGLQMMGYA